ncbi:MAG: DUF983 domain-containing protein [Saprospiraceae bacterium]|nr:DUF983 domain-containing protein [Saprospiraceae bacterium]
MSRISSIFKMTCPRCRQSKLFEAPMQFSKPLAMNKKCSVCGQKFEPEPGFYFGAMFISYIFLAFFSLGLTGLLVFYFHQSVDFSFLILLLILGVMFIWNLRFSRSIWIHLVVKYDSKAIAQTHKP